MRISDWSSDVCSSDLCPQLVVLNGCAGKGFAHRACQCPNFLDGMGTGNEARLFNGRGDEESPLQKGLVQCGEKSRILLRHFSMIVESLSPRNENKRKDGSATYEAIGRTGVLQSNTHAKIQSAKIGN